MLNGDSKKDVEKFMNEFFEEECLLKSKFFVFFLSCTNMKKFKNRKNKEYETSFFNFFRDKNQSPNKTQNNKKKNGANSKLIADVNPEENEELVRELKTNLFVEDLTAQMRSRTEGVAKAGQLYERITELQNELNEKLAELGNIFCNLSNGYSLLEQNAGSEIRAIVPNASQLYGSLKLIFFNLSNALSTQAETFTKFLKPSFSLIEEASTQFLEVWLDNDDIDA